METSTLFFAILTICLVGTTLHAWRLGNEKGNVPCLHGARRWADGRH